MSSIFHTHHTCSPHLIHPLWLWKYLQNIAHTVSDFTCIKSRLNKYARRFTMSFFLTRATCWVNKLQVVYNFNNSEYHFRTKSIQNCSRILLLDCVLWVQFCSRSNFLTKNSWLAVTRPFLQWSFQPLQSFQYLKTIPISDTSCNCLILLSLLWILYSSLDYWMKHDVQQIRIWCQAEEGHHLESP